MVLKKSERLARQQRLRAAMDAGRYSPAKVAKLLDRSRDTVYGWLCETDNLKKTIPKDALVLLERLAKDSAQQRKYRTKRN